MKYKKRILLSCIRHFRRKRKRSDSVLCAFKVTADSRGDNSPMLYRSRNVEMQIIRSDDTQINIQTFLNDKIK